MDEDALIVRKILRGKSNEFSRIVEKYQRPIFNFVYRFFGNYDLATELAQDTFLKCFQSLKSYDQERKFSTWLYTIAKNICIDEYKKRKLSNPLYLEDVHGGQEGGGHPDPGGTPQSQAILREEGARLNEALQKLDPEKRTPLILHYYQGLAYNEIAETEGIPLSTVKIRIFRAKKALLDLLEPRGEG
jgi:RNA polymerase sigma-70 factor (ECF subfamily)